MKSKAIFVAASLIMATAFWSCSNDNRPASRGSSTSSERPQANPLRNAYFGDTHIHTSWSIDAYTIYVRTTPEDAYRFGQGEEIDHPTAGKVKLQPPLDFMAVTDHAEYMGVVRFWR